MKIFHCFCSKSVGKLEPTLIRQPSVRRKESLRHVESAYQAGSLTHQHQPPSKRIFGARNLLLRREHNFNRDELGCVCETRTKNIFRIATAAKMIRKKRTRRRISHHTKLNVNEIFERKKSPPLWDGVCGERELRRAEPCILVMCGDLLYTMELFRLNLQHLRQVSKDYQFLVGLFSSPRSTRDFEDETWNL